MKKSMAHRSMWLFLVIIVSCNDSFVHASILTELNERFNVFTITKNRFKKASEAYNACLYKKCSGEIATMKRVTDDLSKTTKSDTELRRLLDYEKIEAQKKYDACAKAQCSAEYAFFNNSKRVYESMINVIIVLLTTGAFLFLKGRVQKVAKKEIEKRAEIEEKSKERIDELIEKYGIKDDEAARRILVSYSQINPQNKRKIYSYDVPRLTKPLLQALATIHYQKSRVSDEEFNVFISTFQIDNQIFDHIMQSFLYKPEEESLQ